MALPSFPRCRSAEHAAALRVALAFLAGPASFSASGAVWTNVNPGGGGAFTAAAAGPTGILLVGSDIGGAYRSADGGVTWDNVGYLNGGLERTYIGAVAFDPEDPAIAYLGLEGGLYRSADTARTFSQVVAGGFWTAIAASPSDPATVYAARHSAYNTADPRIYRSTNRGLSWALAGALPAGTRVLELAVRPDQPAQLFALSGYEKLMGSAQPRRALFVSGDGGASWTDAHGDSTNQGMTGNPWDAAYDPGHPDTIYATSVVGAGNPDVASSWSGYTWRGSQSGGTWAQLSMHTGAILVRRGVGEATSVLTIDVRRDGPGCQECGVFGSTDAGATWTHVSDMSGWDTAWIGSIAWAFSGAATGVSRTLGRDLSDPSAIYWVTPQFVWRSGGWGAMFSSLFADEMAPGYWKGRGIDNTAPAALSASGAVLYAGLYDLGIWRSLDLGASWQSSNDPAFTGAWNGRGGSCMTIVADPADPDVVWASQGESMDQARLIRSLSGAAPGSWTAASGIPTGFLSGLSLDPMSPPLNRTLYATSNGDVYKSTNHGVTWSQVFNCDMCYVTEAAGAVVFAGGQNGLWRSLDSGASWTEIDPATFHLASSGYSLTSAKWNGPHDVLISGTTVYVAVYGSGRGLYKSTDGGTSWTRILADNYERTIHAGANGALYLGSSSATDAGGVGGAGATGIQVSTDAGATWSSLNAGLSWPFVWPIATLTAGGTVTVFAGSPGNGFWRANAGSPLAVAQGHGAGMRVAGFRPNPARDRIAVAFSLASWEPAVLEVFDLAGRRLIRRELGGLGPGDHVLPLEPGFKPRPGAYAVRVTQGGRSVGATSIVVK